MAGYYEYGDPDGTPVVALHGTPACGAGFAWAHHVTHARAIRLLAPDRPGVGDSDPWPDGRGRVVAEYAPVLKAFADALGIERFPVIGYSGGGPYALATAHAFPERVPEVAVVSGAGQVGVWATIDDFEATDRRLARLALRVPVAARAVLDLSARAARLAPTMALRFAQLEMSAADRAVMARFPSARAAIAVFSAACRPGAGGVVADYAALGRPWAFPVEDISVPVHCWHAPADPVVPISHTEELARRIPGARASRWDGEGHLAIVDHVDEVLAALVPR